MKNGKTEPSELLKLVTMEVGAPDVVVWGTGSLRPVRDRTIHGCEAMGELITDILKKESDAGILFLVEAIGRLQNSYHWTGGVPDVVSGQIVDVTRNDEWFQFLCEPRSNHIPLERRLAMGRRYIQLALERNFENVRFWGELLVSVPEICSTCRLLRAAGTVHVTTLAA